MKTKEQEEDCEETKIHNLHEQWENGIERCRRHWNEKMRTTNKFSSALK